MTKRWLLTQVLAGFIAVLFFGIFTGYVIGSGGNYSSAFPLAAVSLFFSVITIVMEIIA